MLDCTANGRSVDALGDILEMVHVQEARAEVLVVDGDVMRDESEPNTAVIWIVLSGRVVCDFAGEPAQLCHRDAVLRLRAAATDEPSGVHDSEFDAQQEPSRSPAETGTLLRCTCQFEDSERNPLMGALPSVVRIGASQWAEPEWLEPTIAWLAREADSRTPGARVVVNRLVELLWVQMVRAHIAATQVVSQGWLRALSDTQIGGALGLIHEKPATAFTVASLAQAVGMSRSAFASQFTRLVGEPPLHYVARWRMLKAAHLLKEDKQTLAEVAIAVGYESEAAFSKAFKRWSGQAPGSFRRERRCESGGSPQRLVG